MLIECKAQARRLISHVSLPLHVQDVDADRASQLFDNDSRKISQSIWESAYIFFSLAFRFQLFHFFNQIASIPPYLDRHLYNVA